MSTVLDTKRWLGVALLIALFSLFAVTDLQAKDAAPVAIVLDVTCDLDVSDTELWMAVEEPIAPCAETVELTVRSVDFVGDMARTRVIVGDRTESRFYRRTDVGWERIEFAVADDGEMDYLTELENADYAAEQYIGFTPEPTVQSTNRAPGIGHNVYWDLVFGIEDELHTGVQHTDSSAESTKSKTDLLAVEGNAYWDYVFELVAGETDQ
jgi:hypothetical protein